MTDWGQLDRVLTDVLSPEERRAAMAFNLAWQGAMRRAVARLLADDDGKAAGRYRVSGGLTAPRPDV